MHAWRRVIPLMILAALQGCAGLAGAPGPMGSAGPAGGGFYTGKDKVDGNEAALFAETAGEVFLSGSALWDDVRDLRARAAGRRR